MSVNVDTRHLICLSSTVLWERSKYSAFKVNQNLRFLGLRSRSTSDKYLHRCSFSHDAVNRLTPNDSYTGRTAPLTSKRCILYIYSTNISTEYFKHALFSSFFSHQNAVCFIMLTSLVPVLFTFYIQNVLKLEKNNSGAKGLIQFYLLMMSTVLLKTCRGL